MTRRGFIGEVSQRPNFRPLIPGVPASDSLGVELALASSPPSIDPGCAAPKIFQPVSPADEAPIPPCPHPRACQGTRLIMGACKSWIAHLRKAEEKLRNHEQHVARDLARAFAEGPEPAPE